MQYQEAGAGGAELCRVEGGSGMSMISDVLVSLVGTENGSNMILACFLLELQHTFQLFTVLLSRRKEDTSPTSFGGLCEKFG